MKAVVLRGPSVVEIAQVPEPDATDGALVQLELVGICGTDVKIVKGDIPVDYPRVLGHELIGRVVQAGPRAIVPAGTRVLVDPAVACGHCELCRADRANICRWGALLGRDLDGGFAERIAVDELRLHPVPESIEPAAAALLQVLGTCVHAQAGVDVRPPDTAVVIGLGVTGLLHVQLLRARGIRRIVGVTRSETKRQLALRLGASAVAAPADAEDLVASLTDGRGADLVIEAVGSVPTLSQAIGTAASGATIVVFGTITAARAEELPFYQLYYKELRILNPRAALGRDYDRAIALATAGEVELAPLWSRSYPLEEAATAFHEVADPGSLKVTLDV
ncbi:MAG: alcohol dehydrogenase catalytic domain-containing protein [Chloroflexota bacterium]|nr:alcohol dehydrogenase catalytic domain-containing protein [Chloroflexota bacterium]